MILKIARRMIRETDKRLLFKFIWNFGWKGMRSVQKFNSRVKKGSSFPAFMVMSVTNSCNLKCQGCWVTPSNPIMSLSVEQMDNVVTECKKHGSYFFGILGGEPLLHPGIFELFEKHPDAYFQLFTNGTLLDNEVAAKLCKLGNVTPLISIEGKDDVADERRGGTGVFRRSLDALKACSEQRLITGVATSVCKSNFEDLVSENFVNELIKRKVQYVWYYIYRPVGPDPCPELALSEEEILKLREFMVDLRCKAPIIVVDAYWDHEGKALCPAASGLSHHINSDGYIEFCPPLQFARDKLGEGKSLTELLEDSAFLKEFRNFASESRGCVLLERPDALKNFLEGQGGLDTTGRNSGFEELAAMNICPGHNIPGKEIPEKHWAYRFAKKHWFFGFGAYG